MRNTDKSPKVIRFDYKAEYQQYLSQVIEPNIINTYLYIYRTPEEEVFIKPYRVIQEDKGETAQDAANKDVLISSDLTAPPPEN